MKTAAEEYAERLKAEEAKQPFKKGDIVLGNWGNRLYDERGETSGGYGLLKITGRPVSGKGYPVALVNKFGDNTGQTGYVAKKDIKRKAVPSIAWRYS